MSNKHQLKQTAREGEVLQRVSLLGGAPLLSVPMNERMFSSSTVNESEFWERFKPFALREGIQTKKPPKLLGFDISLFKLFEAVFYKRGGFKKVDAATTGQRMRSVWRDVADEITGQQMDKGSTSTRIKNHYTNFLLKFEHECKQTHAKKQASVFSSTPIDLTEQPDEEMQDDSRRTDLYDSLHGTGLLTDTVIDDFGRLLQTRSDQNVQILPRIHMFSTHFFSMFKANGYPVVKQFTHGGHNNRSPRFNIFECDYVFFPVHRPGGNGHWVLIVANISNQSLTHYDPLHAHVNAGGDDERETLLDYLRFEHAAQHNGLPLPAAWSQVGRNQPGVTSDVQLLAGKIPTQSNCYDCGVFVCTYTEYISRRSQLTFDQTSIPAIRSGMFADLQSGLLSAPYVDPVTCFPRQDEAVHIAIPSPPASPVKRPGSPVRHGELAKSLPLLKVSAMPRIPRLPYWKKKVFEVSSKISYQDAISLLATMYITDEITLEEFLGAKKAIDKLCTFGILEERNKHAVETAKFQAVKIAYSTLIHKRRSSISSNDPAKERLNLHRFQVLLKDAEQQAQKEINEYWKLLKQTDYDSPLTSALVEIIRCFEDTYAVIEQQKLQLNV